VRVALAFRALQNVLQNPVSGERISQSFQEFLGRRLVPTQLCPRALRLCMA
jgi:hypothetical protein